MKASLNWLTEYVDVSAEPAQRLAAVLTNIGLVCDAMQQTDSDVVFDLDVTSNRPDCLGHIGVARELAAALGLPLRLPDLALAETSPPASELTSVEVLAPDLCPRYTARVVRNVKVGPSPAWMVERLQAVGLRSVNNIVDVTNYVLMEYSQPLHSFDLDRLEGRRIVVRRGAPGEEIVSIDGTRCRLGREMCVIADARKPVAVAGIMGGLESEIGLATRNVLIEAAQFDPMTTRRTARHLMLMTDSSYRFERGVDPVGVELASRRACQLILQLAGGELAKGVVDVWANLFRPPQVAMRTDRCRQVLGLDVSDRDQQAALARLGLSPRAEGGRIVCTIPPHRGDLQREIDLIEEVARLHGYDKIPLHDRVTHPVVPVSPLEKARHDLRDALAAAGFDEAVTYSFVDRDEAELLGFAQGFAIDERIRKSNNVLRPTLLPSLLRACKANQDAGNEDVNLYELAAVFPPAGSTGILVAQATVPPVSLGAPTAGTAVIHTGETPVLPDTLPDEHVVLGLVSQQDVAALRGAIDAVAAALSPAAKVEVEPAAVAGLAEGASGRVAIDGEPAGIIGLAAPAVLDRYGLEKPYAVAQLRFDVLRKLSAGPRLFRPLPKLPPVRRDLSLVVDEAVAWKQVADLVAGLHQPALEAMHYVDTYRGSQVPPGKKSVTLTLRYRSAEQTLRGEQVDQMVGQLVEAAGQKLGAELRT